MVAVLSLEQYLAAESTMICLSNSRLVSYVARMNIQLLKAIDFNNKMRERGCPKTATVQKVCRTARNETEVRQTLDAIWENSIKSEEILKKLVLDNEDLYRFERILDNA